MFKLSSLSCAILYLCKIERNETSVWNSRKKQKPFSAALLLLLCERKERLKMVKSRLHDIERLSSLLGKHKKGAAAQHLNSHSHDATIYIAPISALWKNVDLFTTVDDISRLDLNFLFIFSYFMFPFFNEWKMEIVVFLSLFGFRGEIFNNSDFFLVKMFAFWRLCTVFELRWFDHCSHRNEERQASESDEFVLVTKNHSICLLFWLMIAMQKTKRSD